MKTIVDSSMEFLDPDSILPAQFQRLWYSSKPLSPERLLMLGILWQAQEDLVKNCGVRQGKRQRLYQSTYGWVASNDRSWPFSFVNVCEALNLSPTALRRALIDDELRAVA